MVKPELLLGPPEEALELRASQQGDRDYVPAPVLPDVDGEVAFRHVEREAPVPFIVPAVLLPEARAPLEDLLDKCCLRELGGLPDDGH